MCVSLCPTGSFVPKGKRKAEYHVIADRPPQRRSFHPPKTKMNTHNTEKRAALQ